MGVGWGQDCVEGVEVELWGWCYNIEETTSLVPDPSFTSGQVIPPEIGQLINLTEIHLNSKGLIGSIPTEIGNLTNLYYFWLYNNQLTGEIPPEVCDLIENNYLYMVNILSGNYLINTCD